MMRGDFQKRPSGNNGTPHSFDIGALQITQPAVDDLEAVGRSGMPEIEFFDQGNGESLQCRLSGDSGPVYTATDNQKIEGMALESVHITFHTHYRYQAFMAGTQRCMKIISSSV